jgi:hypothetical protein
MEEAWDIHFGNPHYSSFKDEKAHALLRGQDPVKKLIKCLGDISTRRAQHMLLYLSCISHSSSEALRPFRTGFVAGDELLFRCSISQISVSRSFFATKSVNYPADSNQNKDCRGYEFFFQRAVSFSQSRYFHVSTVI